MNYIDSSSNESFPDHPNFFNLTEEFNFNYNNFTLGEKMDNLCVQEEEEESSYQLTEIKNKNIEKILLKNTNYNCKNKIDLNYNYNTLDFENSFNSMNKNSFQSTEEIDINLQKTENKTNEKIVELSKISPISPEITNSINKGIIYDLTKEEKEEININNPEKKFLNKKRKLEDEIVNKIFDIKKLTKEEKLLEKNSKLIKINSHKYGRKKKSDKNNGKHNKSSGDNIINKIKGHFINHFIIDIIKKNSINEIIYLKKIPNEFIENLSKTDNEKLFKKKIKDILSEVEISTKYKKYKRDVNKVIINNIFEEKKQTKIMQILELTFKELFIVFRAKLNDEKDKEEIINIKNKIEGINLFENSNYEDISYLIKNIRQKMKDMEQNKLEEYIEKVKYQCCYFEKWFNDKIARKN